MNDDTRSQPPEEQPTATRPPTDPDATRDNGTPAPKLERPEVPGYAVLDKVGEGGMGFVYRALHLKLNRTVALKMVHGGKAASPKELIRFLAEAEAVAQSIIRTW